MESEELKRRFTPKVLSKRISGQRLLPTHDFKSFKYGDFEEVWVTPFQFVYYFGGFPGAPFQQPGEAFACILSQSWVLTRIFGKSKSRTWTGTTRNLERTDKCPLQVGPLAKGW